MVEGPGDQPGRIVAAVGSMFAGCGLVIGATVALATVGEEHIPGGAGGSEEAAMKTARRLAAIDIGLAAVSLGLGIATITTYDSEVSDHGLPADSVQMRLTPVVVPMAGKEGLCARRGDACVAAVDQHCRVSQVCRAEGRCTAEWHECEAGSDLECRLSTGCREGDDCFYNREKGLCDEGTERNGVAMMVTGIVLLGGGGVAAVSGAVLYVPYLDFNCNEGFCEGTALLIGGGVLAAVGLPLTIAGAVKVPREARVGLAVGPNGAALVGTF